MEITWTRDGSCGNSEVCPKVGKGDDGWVYAVGVVTETTPEQRRALGIGEGEALLRIPADLLPEV